jgi:hypothetical protein
MRQILAALCVYFLVSASVGAQTKTDRDIQGLVGPVKTLSIKRTETPLRDGQPSEPKVVEARLLTFDVQGHQIQQYRGRPDGTPWMKWVYVYDANGYMTEQSEYEPPERLITKKTYRNEFDAEGRLTTASIYDADGKLDHRIVRNYNYRGLLADGTTYDRNGSVSNKSVFTYDEKGGLAEFALYNSMGVLVQKQIHTGAQNDMILNNDDGTPRMREIRIAPVREEFDSHGNWTKLTTKKVVTQSGRTEDVVEITRRIITYY